MGEGSSSHAADTRLIDERRGSEDGSLSLAPSGLRYTRQARERERELSSGGGCPRHASRRLGRGTHYDSKPDQTTRLDERRESIKLSPRREDSALTQPRRVACAAAAVAATAPALVVECVRRRRGSQRAPATATQYLQYACAIAGSLRSCCSTVDIRHSIDALVAP